MAHLYLLRYCISLKMKLFNFNIENRNLIITFVAIDFLETEFKGALSGQRQLLATESPLKMIKNAFYFTSKALFVLKIFKFLS